MVQWAWLSERGKRRSVCGWQCGGGGVLVKFVVPTSRLFPQTGQAGHQDHQQPWRGSKSGCGVMAGEWPPDPPCPPTDLFLVQFMGRAVSQGCICLI